ncbi:Haloacid dehalogenase, type II [Mycena venus]|uniref:Haloacid dehalogenase, type II n=1 Tax=Mycena venus TaxID=2733690 RepID=A0A8H6YNW6_9AGAR|nr:Haloacid dehalogenase, type II [Mycena venus]
MTRNSFSISTSTAKSPRSHTMSGPCVIFDVVGTCFGYDSVEDSLHDVLASHAATIPPKLFFSAWTSNAELDFQRLSIVEKFRSHSSLLKNAFYKTMKDAEIPEASIPGADIDLLIEQYSHNLTPRPGLSEMIQILRDGGFTVWCCSDASPERLRSYFEKAGIDMPLENLLSCDMWGGEA